MSTSEQKEYLLEILLYLVAKKVNILEVLLTIQLLGVM